MQYLLCRPMNGLNDMLCYLYICYNYCYKNNITLLIDTTYKECCMGSSFDSYFNFNKNNKINIISNIDEINNILKNNNFTIYPNISQSELFDYTVYFNNSIIYISNYNIEAQINFCKIYSENLLLCNSFSCGEDSLKLLNFLTLNKQIISEIWRRYDIIEKPYTSIHIRNTDYKTDYIKIYNNNKKDIINSNIFLASDSIDVVNFYKNIEFIKLYNFNNSLNNDNNPIHYYCNNKYSMMVDTLCDLILLALGNKFIKPENMVLGFLSGFTRLAYNLFNNKDLVYSLLGKTIEL